MLSSWAQPHSSVGNVADLRTGGCWFDLWLGQYSFRGFMISHRLERILCRAVIKRTPGKDE